MSRWLAYGFGLAMVAVVALPGLGDPARDSYPLSTYPMFARPRDKPWLNFAEGVDAEGLSRRLAPSFVGTGEVMQAASTVRRAVQAGPEAVSALCESIAERVAKTALGRELVEIRIVGARYDPLRYFDGGREPELRNIHHRCEVPKTQ